ncbi:MAG: hypothetical protein ABI617_01960 [Sphingomicrobium sp.]
MATGAAALMAKARRDIQHEFFSRDAVRADRAIEFDPSRHFQRRVFERWQRSGVIHEGRPGRYWLDVAAYDVDLRRRHNRLRVALLIVVGLLAAGLITGWVTPH